MNDDSRRTLPSWLDARTVAILAALIALGTMMQTAQSNLRSDMNRMREELSEPITKLDERLRAVEIDVAAIRAGLFGLAAPVPTVVPDADGPLVRAKPPRPNHP